MPTDHEEAVREARGTVRGLAHRVSPQRLLDEHNNALDAFEAAIRASERAKYAALVEAATNALTLITHGDYRNGVTDPTGTMDEGDVRAGRVYTALKAALAAREEVQG